MSVATLSPRRTALTQAIDEVVLASLEVTVSNTLPVYMRIVGFSASDSLPALSASSSTSSALTSPSQPNTVVNDGIRAFERALEKSHGNIDTRAWKLWNEYFYKKLGGPTDGDGICHWCETCGRICFKGKKDACSKMLEQREKKAQAQKQLQAAEEEQARLKKKLKKVKASSRKKKAALRRERRSSSVESEISSPSSSHAVL